jgi:60 kDa SS-A/Ro ribonucleoprotein
MSRFATKSPGTKTTNLAGGAAYTQTAKTELVSMVLTSFVQNDFYRNETSTLKRLEELVNQDPVFAAKLAIFARDEFNMRTVSHVVASLVAKAASGSQWGRKFYYNIVVRVDDITEILAYHFSRKQKLSKIMQKGLADSFDKFNEYQLAKYKGEGKRPSLIDAVNLLHPKPSEKNAAALTALMKGELKSTGTFQSELSAAGQTEGTDEDKIEAKKDAWVELVTSRKLGYMALLRNLRNIIQQAPEVLDKALEQLTDEKAISKSRVLPFRFYSAYKELFAMGGEAARRALVAVDKAINFACNNFDALPGKTVIFLDVSGSMDQPLSAKSDMKLNEVAALFAAIIAKRCNADIVKFDTTAYDNNFNPNDSVMTMVKSIGFNGGGTNFNAPFEHITSHKRKYDRVIILSDMQAWIQGYSSPVGAYSTYCSMLGIKPNVISWDLKGYGTLQFPESNIFLLAGWSEKLFALLAKLEQDKNALVKDIENVTL